MAEVKFSQHEYRNFMWQRRSMISRVSESYPIGTYLANFPYLNRCQTLMNIVRILPHARMHLHEWMDMDGHGRLFGRSVNVIHDRWRPKMDPTHASHLTRFEIDKENERTRNVQNIHRKAEKTLVLVIVDQRFTFDRRELGRTTENPMPRQNQKWI